MADDLWRVRAPFYTPKWLVRVDKVLDYVDVDASGLTDEDIAGWPKAAGGVASPLDLQEAVSDSAQSEDLYNRVMRANASQWLLDALDALQLRHEGSPVWWTHLTNGPAYAASLLDLVYGCVIDERYYTVGVTPKALALNDTIRVRYNVSPPGDRVHLLSLAQWDSASWPAESEDGPPFTPHVSVYR